MTRLTTIFGLVPLALGLCPGAEMQQPLAIAVIGGLIANMFVTRLLIPVGYLVLQGKRASEPVAFRFLTDRMYFAGATPSDNSSPLSNVRLARIG
jgi:hypothetical protein